MDPGRPRVGSTGLCRYGAQSRTGCHVADPASAGRGATATPCSWRVRRRNRRAARGRWRQPGGWRCEAEHKIAREAADEAVSAWAPASGSSPFRTARASVVHTVGTLAAPEYRELGPTVLSRRPAALLGDTRVVTRHPQPTELKRRQNHRIRGRRGASPDAVGLRRHAAPCRGPGGRVFKSRRSAQQAPATTACQMA